MICSVPVQRGDRKSDLSLADDTVNSLFSHCWPDNPLHSFEWYLTILLYFIYTPRRSKGFRNTEAMSPSPPTKFSPDTINALVLFLGFYHSSAVGPGGGRCYVSVWSGSLCTYSAVCLYRRGQQSGSTVGLFFFSVAHWGDVLQVQ